MMHQALKIVAIAFAGTAITSVCAEQAHHHHGQHNMVLDRNGMVMHGNTDQLPRDCAAIAREYELTIRAGRKYAEPFADKVFGYTDYQLNVEPCSRLRINFINEDKVRHQWMVHGLPRYLYGQGMFHLEAAGGSEVSGSLIVPSDHKTYLIHCDIAQHMEKGMKAQLVVGKGSGDLWAIPGVSADFVANNHSSSKHWLLGGGILMVAVILGFMRG